MRPPRRCIHACSLFLSHSFTHTHTFANTHQEISHARTHAEDGFLDAPAASLTDSDWNEDYRDICERKRALEESIKSRKKAHNDDDTHSLLSPSPLLSPSSTLSSRLQDLNSALLCLTKDFIEAASTYGRIIILERTLPPHKKTIKPSSIGGLCVVCVDVCVRCVCGCVWAD